MLSAAKLKTGTGSFDLVAGVDQAFSGGFNAFAKAEVEWHPIENITAGAFARADLEGVTAGLEIGGTF